MLKGRTVARKSCSNRKRSRFLNDREAVATVVFSRFTHSKKQAQPGYTSGWRLFFRKLFDLFGIVFCRD